MKRSGRIGLPLIIIVCVLAIGGVFFAARGEQPTTGATIFLDALGKGDVNTLVDRSFIDGVTPEELRKRWEVTVKERGPYYRWTYRIKDQVISQDDNATVRIDMIRNALKGSATPEPFQVPMQREGDKWKVDVRGLSREMYPGLPR